MIACIALWALTASEPPAAAAEMSFVVAPNLQTEAGARSIESFSRLLFSCDAALPEPEQPLVAAALRLARTVFVDAPLLSTETVLIHEVFGHGARAKEAGAPTLSMLQLPLPFTLMGGPFAAGETTGLVGQTDRDLGTIIGGIEANMLSAALLAEQWTNNPAHESELGFYLLSKTIYIGQFLNLKTSSLSTTNSSDDVQAYSSQLQRRYNLYTPGEADRLISHLGWGYLGNFADPLLWWSAYAYLVHYLWRGERWMTPPSLALGAVSVMPSVRFAPSPFCIEHTLDLWLRGWHSTAMVSLRAASTGLALDIGATLRLVRLQLGERFLLGGGLDVWNQPELLFDQRNVFVRPQLWGVSASADLRVRLWRRFGVIGKIAYKTKGYLMGQPEDAGVYGFGGLWLSP